MMEESVSNSKVGEDNDGGGETDKTEFATPSSTSSPAVAPGNTPVSTPDLTPSRRSSRKKQSTFSSDFEYYSIGRKVPKEEKEEVPVSEDNVAEEQGKVDDDSKPVPKKSPQGMQRKVATRTKPVGKKTLLKAGAGAKLANNKVKLKAALKKAKSMVLKKSVKNKKKMEEESEEDDDDDDDIEEENKTPTKKAQKRKKVPVKAQASVKNKKAKKVEEPVSESDSSDAEDSTPISELKAKLATSKPGTASKKNISILPTSPLAKNLMSKLKKASQEILSSPEGLLAGQKRKLSTAPAPVKRKESGASIGSDDDEIPLKKLQLEKNEGGDPLKQAGLVKRSPLEIAKKKVAKPKQNEPSTEVKKEKSDDAPTPKKAKVKKEGEEDMKKKSADAVSIKKEIKTEMKEEKGESSKKVDVKGGPIPTKKDNGEVKKVMKVVKTADGRIIKGEVRFLKDGRKVMVIDGKQKVLVTGKDKESKQSAQKPMVKKEEVTPSKPVASVSVKKLVKTPDASKKIKKEQGGSIAMKKSKDDNTDVKKSVSGVQKSMGKGQRVDDLLKRGVVVKKKRHQPFGNKNTVAKIIRPPEGKTGADGKPGKKSTVSPKSAEKKERKKSLEKSQNRKSVDVDGRRLSESKSIQGRDRSLSNDSSKGERRKSSDSGKNVSSSMSGNVKSGPEDEKTEDTPPVLIPANAIPKPPKHKHHHKPEHDTSLDMTMNDLFKPDTIISTKKDHENDTSTSVAAAAVDGGNKEQMPSGDADSPIKPQNLPNVLIEHGYSKPSSPETVNSDGAAVSSSTPGGGLQQQDLNSMSVPTNTVVTDMNLPDQFMEEPEMHDHQSQKQDDDVVATWPDNMEELKQMVNNNKKDGGSTIASNASVNRPSILESLDTELQEGGSEFLIVGQVEIGRPLKDVAVDEGQEKESTARPVSSNGKEVVKETNVDKAAGKVSETVKKTKPKRRYSSEDGKKKTKKHSPEKKGSDHEDDEEEDDNFVDDHEDDDDWEPSDPSTLYCICQKPHGHRFMICCDKCEEWYHGSCVGISRARGKEMEDNEEEYICPVCQKGDCTTPTKPAQGTPAKTSDKTPVPKPTSKLTQKCVGRKCNNIPRTGSVYCSNECIMSHAQESLKVIREDEHKKKTQEKHKHSSPKEGSHKSTSSVSFKPSETVMVVEKETGRIIQGSAAPSQKNLRQWLEEHPTFQVFHGGKQKSSSSSSSTSISTLSFYSSESSKDSKHRDKESRHSSTSHRSSESERKDDRDSSKSRRDSKDGGSSAKKIDGERRKSSTSSSSSSKAEGASSKPSEKSEDGPNQVRLNVRTALRNSLSARAQSADDIMLSSNEIKNLAVTIEEELHNLFLDTGHKYRTKYRSLVFNIKDSKNKGLFRKILTGKIKPYKLVQMSTEELASRELAKWREKESKHQLEMIEQTEKEALKESMGSKHVRKKTHKGEIEVEEEDLTILEARLDEKVEKAEDAEEMNQVPVVDTTDQHRAHLFDLNCKVCTGKIVPGPEEQAVAAKKVTFSLQASTTKIISDDEPYSEVDDFAKAEEIVKEAMRTVKKTSEAISSWSPPPEVSESPQNVMAPESPPLESSSTTSPPKPDPISSTSLSSSSSSSTQAVSSASSPPSTMKSVVVRSPDSALQSGLEVKAKYVPTGPLLWKGCISMLDVAKFFTSAYRISGPHENITLPDTIHIMGRISPDHMWDYLSKIRQAGSKDMTVLRFIPGSDDEKVAYVHLYSYLNSRSRCGVAGNPSKLIKDFYVIPLASHSKIPRTLLPFDGPGLEENRPHMLIGILVQQRGKHSSSDSPASSGNGNGTSGTSGSTKSKTATTSGGASSSSSSSSSKHSSSRHSSSKHRSSSSSSRDKDKKTIVNRDPRLAKLAAAQPKSSISPTDSTSSGGSSHNSKSSGTPNTDVVSSPSILTAFDKTSVKKSEDSRKAKKVEENKDGDIYEPEYIPMPVKTKTQPVAEYVPTVKKKDKETESGEKHHHHHHNHHHHPSHHHHQSHADKSKDAEEDDSEPYSPGKEAEPYSPSQEAQADEPYDPADESLMDDSGIPIPPLPQPSSSSSSLSATASTTPAPSALAVTPAVSSDDVTSTTFPAKLAPSSVQKSSGAGSNVGISSSSSTTPSSSQSDVGTLAKTTGSKIEAIPVKSGSFSIDDCVEKMARSNNPTEISSLMVTALSTAATPEEQQKLLVDLTKRVEERKLQLANLSRAGAGQTPAASTTTTTTPAVKQGDGESLTSSNSTTAVGSSKEMEVSVVAQSSGNSPEVSSSTKSLNSEESKLDSFSKNTSSSLLPPTLSSSLKPSSESQNLGFSISSPSSYVFDTDNAKNIPTKPTSDNSEAGVIAVGPTASGDSEQPSKVQIPDALKALMDDVMGNKESIHGEKRVKQLMKEVENVTKGSEDEEKVELEQGEKNVEENEPQEKTEAERRLEDEMEARRILEELNESEKAIGLPRGGKEKKESSSSSSTGGEGEAVGDAIKKDKVPTIDELLAKLKKEGFKFPVAKTTTSSTANTDSTVSTPASETLASAAPTTPIIVPLPSSDSEKQDVDLRTSGTSSLSTVTSIMGISPSPTPADTIAACMASITKRPLPVITAITTAATVDVQDIDHRKNIISPVVTTAPPSISERDKDDRPFYQDQDERVFPPPPVASSRPPKHPLDARAFPPLPGEPPRMYLRPPHFSQSPANDGFISRPKGRAQPPPPGTEFESPSPRPVKAIMSSEFSDVDMRNRGGRQAPIPPLPPEQAPPPLPPQPPPPLPPLPGNRGVDHAPPPLPPPHHHSGMDYVPPPHDLPPTDVDFRSHHHPHHHPHLHHHPPHHHPQHHSHHPHPPHHPPPPMPPPPHHQHHPDNSWRHDRGGRESEYHHGYPRSGGSSRRH